MSEIFIKFTRNGSLDIGIVVDGQENATLETGAFLAFFVRVSRGGGEGERASRIHKIPYRIASPGKVSLSLSITSSW